MNSNKNLRSNSAFEKKTKVVATRASLDNSACSNRIKTMVGESSAERRGRVNFNSATKD
jgi:hypothetical protein